MDLTHSIAAPDSGIPRVKRDWFFLAFVALTAVMSAGTGVQRWRFDRALRRTQVCLANGETACAGKNLEDARAIDDEHPRVRVADANLRVLLGAPAVGQAVLAAVGAGEKLPASARADLLLLGGDVEAALGAAGKAREQWEAARLLVTSQALVDARIERLGQAADDEVAGVKALAAELQRLLGDVAANKGESVKVGARDLAARIERLPNREVAAKLRLALQAAQSAFSEGDVAARSKAMPRPELTSYGLAEPMRPIAPTGKVSAWEEQHYKHQLAAYEAAREAWEARRDAEWKRRQQSISAGERRQEDGLAAARRLVDEAVALAEKSRAPLAGGPQEGKAGRAP